MITTFEEHTSPLTDSELALVPFIVNGFNLREGIKNIITADEICKSINDFQRRKGIKFIKFQGARLRKIIHYIVINRMTRLPLIANSKGYYITGSKSEIDAHLESLYDRMDAIKVRYESVKNWKP